MSRISGAIVFGLATGAALMLGRPALAEEPPRPFDLGNPADLFKQLDKNGDGQVTADEMPQEHRRLFEHLVRVGDKNSDGKLSLEEFKAAVQDIPPPGGPQPGGPGGPGPFHFDPAQMLKKLDKNGDGKITADEIPEERRENFRKMLEHLGKKPDDAVGPEEFARFAGAMMHRQGGGPGPGNPPSGNPQFGPPQFGEGFRGQPGGRPSGPPPGNILFRLLDKNGDGVITDDEISAAPEALAKFAKERGGKITPEMVGLPPARGPRTDGEGNPRRPDQPGREGNPGERAQFMLNRIKALDKDGDGKISKEETEGMIKERFDEFDANHDGFIDEQEIKQMAEKIRERAGQGGQPPERNRRRPGEEKPSGDKPAGEKPPEKKEP